MTQYSDWCDPVQIASINGHEAGVIVSNDDSAGIEMIASTLASKYVQTETLSAIAQSLDKPLVSEHLKNAFPKKASSRSGDLGEILATAYLEEECDYIVGPCRLSQRDHQEWAMRGDDVLGAKIDSAGKVNFAKGEAKSRAKTYTKTILEAREGLQREEGLPSAHSLAQFASRLIGANEKGLGIAIIRLQGNKGIRPDDVLNLMFIFTGNDPAKFIRTDLEGYTGRIAQLAITLRVSQHQSFIETVYSKAIEDGA